MKSTVQSVFSTAGTSQLADLLPSIRTPAASRHGSLGSSLRTRVSSQFLGQYSSGELSDFCTEQYLQTQAYDEVGLSYEQGLLSPAEQEVHVLNQLHVFTAMSTLRVQFKGGETDFRQLLRTRLPELLVELVREDKLNLSIYREKSEGVHGYSKFLLFTNPNPDHKYCLQLFAFAPFQKTPIHDHPCECMSVVVQGELSERFYGSVSTVGGPASAEKTHSKPRPIGSSGILDLAHLDVPHSLKNKKAVQLSIRASGEFLRLNLQALPPAISVHLYEGIDGAGSEHVEVTQRRPEAVEARKGIAAVARMYAQA